MEEKFLSVLLANGPFAMFCAWFMWKDSQRDKRDEARETARVDREEKRIAADQKLAEANTAIAVSMAGLKAFLEAKLK